MFGGDIPSEMSPCGSDWDEAGVSRPRRSYGPDLKVGSDAQVRMLNLATLIEPLSTKDFLNNFWPDKPYCVHGAVERVQGVFTPELSSLEKLSTTATCSSIRTWFIDKDESMRIEIVKGAAACRAYLEGDRMISIDYVRGVSALDEFVKQLGFDLMSPIGLIMPSFYFSPAG